MISNESLLSVFISLKCYRIPCELNVKLQSSNDSKANHKSLVDGKKIENIHGLCDQGEGFSAKIKTKINPIPT